VTERTLLLCDRTYCVMCGCYVTEPTVLCEVVM